MLRQQEAFIQAQFPEKKSFGSENQEEKSCKKTDVRMYPHHHTTPDYLVRACNCVPPPLLCVTKG